MINPTIELDEEVGCAYVKITEAKESLRTYPKTYANVIVLFDVDRKGNLVGIEIVEKEFKNE